MPIYDYACPCGWAQDDEFRDIADLERPCPKCSLSLRPTLGGGHGGSHTFHEGHYEELTGNHETWFTSKKQLKEEAQRRGKYSEYVEG